MPIKPGLLIIAIFLILGCGLQTQAMKESGLLIELECKPAPARLDVEIVGSLVNSGSSPMDVGLSSESFPFEVEVLNSVGHDVLARQRKPSPTNRRVEKATQTIHLEPGERKSITVTLRGYLESRGFSMDVDQAVRPRLVAAASTETAGPFSVFRSNVVDLAGSS